MKFLKLKNIFFSINNLNNHYYYNNFYYYKYKKLKKYIFIKNLNKKLKNFKNKSSLRDSNLPILNKFYNISVYNGKKENFFKNFNKFIELFFYIFIKKNNFFYKYENYNNLMKFLDLKKLNFDFENLIYNYMYEYNSIFDIKISKISKKYKLKSKKKFNFELIYIFNKKRLKFTLKLINNFIKNSKYFNLKNNFFWTFIELILNFKNSFLSKRKTKVYSKAMKKFFKKNFN